MGQKLKDNLNYVLTILSILLIVAGSYGFMMKLTRDTTVNNQQILHKLESFTEKFKNVKEDMVVVNTKLVGVTSTVYRMQLAINTNTTILSSTLRRLEKVE